MDHVFRLDLVRGISFRVIFADYVLVDLVAALAELRTLRVVSIEQGLQKEGGFAPPSLSLQDMESSPS